MSLEAAIAEQTKAILVLTEAVNKQNDLSERMIGLKADAIETVKQTAAKPDAAPKADKAPKETKTESAPETQKAPEGEKVEEKKLDPIGQAIADYVGKGYDPAHAQAKEERAARAAKVKEIFKAIAEKGGVTVEKHTDIPEKFHGAFTKTLAKRVEEGCLVIGKEADGDEDLGL